MTRSGAPVFPSQPTTEHTRLPWRDPGEHGMTGYGDINHVILGDDGKIVGALYANCFDAPGMNELPTVIQAAGNATLIVEAVNSHASLTARVEELEGQHRGACKAADELKYLVRFLHKQTIVPNNNGEITAWAALLYGRLTTIHNATLPQSSGGADR